MKYCIQANRRRIRVHNNREFCEKAIDLYIKGETLPFIVAQLGSSKATVWRILNRAKVARSHSAASKLAFATGRQKVSEALLKYDHKSSPKGADHHNWKGGRQITNTGYVYIHCPEHPNTNSSGYVAEHRLVMEQKVNRYLSRAEFVHHINGIKNDNRPENLQLVSRADHSIRNRLCSNCDLRKEIRLLTWQVMELTKQLQGKLGVECYDQVLRDG